jgi:hypothetical protein
MHPSLSPAEINSPAMLQTKHKEEIEGEGRQICLTAAGNPNSTLPQPSTPTNKPNPKVKGRERKETHGNHPSHRFSPSLARNPDLACSCSSNNTGSPTPLLSNQTSTQKVTMQICACTNPCNVCRYMQGCLLARPRGRRRAAGPCGKGDSLVPIIAGEAGSLSVFLFPFGFPVVSLRLISFRQISG